MKKRPVAKGDETPDVNLELNDEADKFINKKKIQNKVLKVIIDKLQNSPENIIKKPNN